MTRPNWNYLVDVAMFSLMGAMIFIGVLMAFFLASGPVIDEGTKYVWGLHRHQWGDIHMILSFIFTGLFLIHILLHWSWIKGATRKLLRSPATLVLVLLLPVLVVLLSWSVSEKDSLAYAEFGRRAGARLRRAEVPPPPTRVEEVAAKKEQPKKVEINGRMSLLDVEKATGIQARKIAEELGLPQDAPLDQNLGRLRRSYNFQIEQVRDLINKLSGGKIEALDSDAAVHKGQSAIQGKGQGKNQGMGQGKGQGMGQGMGQGKGQGKGQRQGQGLQRQEINGRLSLAEVERLTGVPASALIKKLNLPAGTSKDERLGRLRRRYGFSIQQVRDAVSALKNK
jgi:hypothetical protein